MKRGRWVALLLSGAMMISQCALAVDLGWQESGAASVQTQAGDSLPAVGEIIFEDDFSRSEIKANWVQEPSGAAVQEDGRMTLTRSTGSDIAKLTGYFKEDQTAIEGGVVGVSFDLYRTEETKAQRIQLQLRGISNDPFSVICWQNGRVYVQGSRTAGVTENKLIYDESIYTGDQLQVTYLFDLDNSTFQTWLDGEQVIEQGYPRVANLQSLTQMYLYLENPASTEYSVQLDNVRVFKPAEEEPEPEETVYFEDDFSGSEIKANWVQEPSGAAVQADGRMTLTRSTGSDIAKLTGYFNADQSTITGGKVQVSFELYRPEETKSQRIQMQLRGTSNQPYAAMSWENGRVYIQGSRTAGKEENEILYDKSTYTGDQLQVTYLFDLDNSTFQTWLDGEQVIELGYPRTKNLSNLQHLYMFLEKPASTAYSVQLDNVRVFEPAEEEEPEPGPATIPQEGRMLLLDDFSGESMLSNWVQEPAGVAAQQDGRITLTHTEQTAGGVAKLTGYFNEDQSTITGKKIGISFDMYRTDASKKIQMQFRGEGGGKEPFTSIIWQNGTIQSHYVDTKGESGTSTAPTVGTTYTDDHVQVTYLFDLAEGSFSLWLNGELKLENKYPRTANLKNLQHVYLFLESTNYCSVQLDNFHVFEPAGNTLWQDNFDSAARDARWVTNDEGALVQEGGYLTLTRTDTTSGTATYVDGYFNEDQSSLQGKVGLSFGLRRERTDKRIQLHFKSGTSPFTTLLWETTGIINAHYSDTKGVGTDSKAKELEGDYSSNRIWVDYLFDMDDGSFTLWIDGELKVERKYPRTANLTSLNYLHAYMENADTNTFSLYNWHVYTSSTETPGVPDDDAVAADLEALTQESLLKVPMLDSGLLVDSLDLPTKGENGSTITWESSSMDVIENDGTLTRPAEDLSVQLTATVSRGSASQQKIFDFTVAGQSRDINGMPQGGSIIVEDRFDDNQLDARIKATNGSGSVTEHDGKAYIVRSASGSENMLDYYFNTDQSALTGTIVTEFILNRATETRVNVRLRSSTNKDYTGIDWYGDYLGLHYSSQQGEDGKAEQPDEFYGAQTQLKVTIQVNTAEHSLSMWLNNQLAIDNMYTRIAAADDLRYVRIYLEGNNLTTATVDDFRTYRIISDDDAVAADLETLTQESLLKVPMLDSGLLVDSLDLPAKGQNGSAIAWESNPAGIIASDGTLTRPEEDTAVKLTATVSSGSVSQQKTFDFTVAGTNTDIAGMPQDGIPIVEDRFDDNKLDERIKVSNGSGSVTEHDGKAYIVRSSNGGSGSENMLDYYFNADRSGLTGTIVTEFILNRATATRVNVRLRSSAGREYTGVDWYSDYLTVYASEQKGEDGAAVRQDSFYGAQTQLKVTIKVNTAEQLVSVWLNNQLAIDNMYGRHANANDLQYVRIYLEGGGLTTATVDDFRVYRFLPDMPDEERVQTDIAELTYEKIIAPAEVLQGIIASDIKLPTIGTNGSTIVWTSSHPDLIAVDGTVTRPGSEYEVNPEVTLTATVSSGDYSQQIELKVKVLLEKINLDEEPGLSEIIYEDDFEDGAIDHHITATADNGTIVEEDGVLKVTRTSNDASSPTIADLYAMEDQSMVEGAIGVEYTLTREDNKVVPTRIRSSGSNDGLAVTWNANGAVGLLYRTSATSGQVSTTTSQSFSDELHVKAVFYTENSQVSLWLNGQLILSKVYTRTQASTLQYVRIYLEATNYTTVNIDDFKIYYATMPAIDSLNFDEEWLTDSLLLTEPYVMENIIDSDLNLPTTGKYGSQITWESSDPSLIAEDGTVTRPLDVPDDPEVTLTATLTVGELEVKKTFQFRVLRDFSDAGERLEAGLEALTVSSLTSEDPQQLKYSLALSDKSLYGDTLTWSSSNTAVITNSGRVIRPRSDQPAQQVTLTATMSNGSLSQQKQMTFTVVPDEEYVDPDYMSDEEFFGKWDGAKWVTEGKFDYSRDDMKEVEAAVKEGDYAKASEALLQHMRERDENLPLSLAAREPGWVDMVLDDIHHLQTSKYYQGNATITSTDYTRVVIPVQASAIAKGGTNTYSIIARYNEASSVLIASKETGSMGARLELTVNGQTKNYEVDADAVIRAGNYKTQNYGQETDMEATMFGDFLGDDTSRVLLRFQISDLLETDTVTEARLILYAKVTPAYAGNKSIVALYEPTNTWDENTVNWNTLTGYVYNYNGLPGANTWDAAPGCDVEYTYQMPRFLAWRAGAAEYAYTKDEKYAYKMIRQMMDFIWDKGGMMKQNGQGWGGKTLRGGWPRTLDTAERLRQWVTVMDTLVQSRYMTPECCTAILKNIWDMNDNLMLSNVTSGNWIQNEQMAVIQGALSMPEFAKAEEWIEFGAAKNEELIYVNNFPDGSYIEATGGYNMSAYGTFLDFKRLMINNGRSVSPEFDEMLLNAAYYNLLLRGPGGQNLQYGDQSAGRSMAQKYPELPQWYGDHEIEYIDSFGQKGTEPEWTSRHFPDSRVTMMRADWSTTAPYLFTEVRGGGQHGHRDDNGIIAIAYDRILLNDAGIFTYTGSDPYRQWGISTEAHNTVEINGKNQTSSANNQGDLHDWVTNDAYDFLSQSTKAYSNIGMDHRRSITFIKPNIWIVSDLVTPEDETASNNYKQIWHMLPTANLATDAEEKTIYSNFESGANIIVASADQDVVVTEADGWYDYGYQQLTSAKFAYFEKNNVSGPATYDTVLIPYQSKGATVDVERIALDVPTSQTTALKFNSNVDGEKATTYYMLDYTNDGAVKTMEQYQTDGQLTVVRINDSGAVKEVILNNGNKVTRTDGTVLVDLGKKVEAFSYEVVGNTIELTTNEENVENMKIYTENAVDAVMVNGNSVAFQQEDGQLTLTDEEKPYTPPNDPNANKGGVASGSGGGGGGGTDPGVVPTPTPGTDETPQPGVTPTPDVTPRPFQDTTEHWAKDYIQDLQEKGVLQGDGSGNFYPDNNISRAEFIAMVVRAIGLEEQVVDGVFTDVPADSWYAGAVGAALEAGIISRDTTFRPDDPVTREEISKVVTGARRMVQPPQEVPQDYQLPYADNTLISEWAVGYVREASYLGLMNGRTQTEFDPQGNATRAEMAAVLSRMLSME